MSKKNPYSKHEQEINNLARQFEQALQSGEGLYFDADDLADLADWYFTNHQPDEAWEVLEQGLLMHPDDTVLLVEKANLLVEDGRVEEAMEISDDILDDSDEEVIGLRAKLLIINDKQEEAKALLKEHEGDIDIVGVAYMYLETNLPLDALNWLKKGKMEQEDKDESYLAALGDCLQALDRYDEAIAIVNKLIDLDPYSAHYWYGLALCYYKKELIDKAMEAVDYAIVSDEDFGNAYALKGDLFQHLGNRKLARENYVKALELNAINQEFLDVFDIEDLMKDSQWEKAIKILAKEVTDTQKTPAYRAEAMIQYAFCLAALGEIKKATEWLELAMSLDEQNVGAYLLMGRIYFEKGDELSAVDMWKKALHYEPYDVTWERIANHCLSLQRFDYMEICYEKIKLIRPEDKQVDLVLAILNLLLGDEEKFRKYNRMCVHPLSEQKAKEYKAILSKASSDQLSEAFANILEDNSDRII